MEIAHQGAEFVTDAIHDDIQHTDDTLKQAGQLVDNLVMLRGRLLERQVMLQTIQHQLDEGGKLYDVIKAADASADAALLAKNLAWMEEAIVATSPKELRKIMTVADKPALEQALQGLNLERLKLMAEYSLASLVLIYGTDELSEYQEALTDILDRLEDG